jgi:hypothetical protein
VLATTPKVTRKLQRLFFPFQGSTSFEPRKLGKSVDFQSYSTRRHSAGSIRSVRRALTQHGIAPAKASTATDAMNGTGRVRSS